MTNKNIIKRPLDHIQYGYGLKDCHVNVFKGDRVYKMFYEQGIRKRNNICKDLQKINWTPDKDKTYKIWWYSTNPADPADFGEDVLLYIEEYDTNIDKLNLQKEITDKLYKLNSNKLLRINEFIDKL